MKLPGFWLRHVVTVEPYLGVGPTGPQYGPETAVRAFVEEKTRLVRSPTGDEVVSSATFYARVGATCPAQSKVRLPSGRKTTVIAELRHDGGGLPTPDHVEVQLV
ncbi:hypothetical protein [Streptomyces sp. NBC_00233]|uniref:hypothetical protein n=1 Tax=Streptomyces sp. NBC_00233 TaxID=2975686 RepID=UPI002255A161|nr:hypothetical protein [Streptomyces sp. NBC_00233]MCX5229672.1 hypothetical protein [Streptomyces sp. NBC_00233]